jgi:hypothetical protein
LTLAQATWLTPLSQGAVFDFPREIEVRQEGEHES